MSHRTANAPSLPKEPEITRWLTTPEAADLLRMKTRATCNLVAAGQLPASFVGRQFLIDPRDIEAYVISQRQDFASE
jgi:excisionase family DNA binding protein